MLATLIAAARFLAADKKRQRDRNDASNGAADARTPSDDQRTMVEKGLAPTMERGRDGPEEQSFRQANLRHIMQLSLAAPFIASLIAPLSTLLDVPGVSQHWFYGTDSDGNTTGDALPDPSVNLALSATGLVLNVIANLALIFRFSTGEKWWKRATVISVFAWWLKTGVAAANVAVFSTYSGPADASDTELSGGFWAAVASLALAGTISLLLGFHLAFEGLIMGDKTKAASIDARTAGRHFQFLVMLQILFIGLFALLCAFVESWTYIDSIYFSVVTMLTIGYGDLTPSHTVTRVLLFPYALVAIAFLANLIGEIANWLSERAESRRHVWRIRYEAQCRAAAESKGERRSLGEEIAFLKRVADTEERTTLAIQLSIAVTGIIAYWLLGALIFSLIHPEDLGFGTATYRYGDFSPSSEGGRVFFIVYAIAAVPIITSFAVQTFTAILSSVADRRFENWKMARELDEHSDAYRPHGRLVLRHLTQTDATLDEKNGGYDLLKLKAANDEKAAYSDDSPSAVEEANSSSQDHPAVLDQTPTATHEERKEAEQEDVDALPGGADEHEAHLADVDPDPQRRQERLITLTIDIGLRLEALSRQLLIMSLPSGSPAQLLLRADMNIQARDVRALNDELQDAASVAGADNASIFGLVDQTTLLAGGPSSDDTLKLVGRYREALAAYLAAASRLKGLTGVRQCHFERRPQEPGLLPRESDPAEQLLRPGRLSGSNALNRVLRDMA